MKILHDHQGLTIRITDERLAHVFEHPEMVGMEAAIGETLAHPEWVVQSFSDPQAHLYPGKFTKVERTKASDALETGCNASFAHTQRPS